MNTRHLAGSIVSECLCRNCFASDSRWKRYIKIATRRSVRRSKNKVIIEGINNG